MNIGLGKLDGIDGGSLLCGHNGDEFRCCFFGRSGSGLPSFTPPGPFIREQIAGDVLEPVTRDRLAATGFLVAGPYDEIQNVAVPATGNEALREIIADVFEWLPTGAPRPPAGAANRVRPCSKRVSNRSMMFPRGPQARRASRRCAPSSPIAG